MRCYRWYDKLSFSPQCGVGRSDSFRVSLSHRCRLIGPRPTDPGPHVELGVLAHVVGVPLRLADVRHRGIIVLLLHAVVDAVLVVLHALGFFHAVQQGQGGFRTGLGLIVQSEKVVTKQNEKVLGG